MVSEVRKITRNILCFLFVAALFVSCQTMAEAPDYSNPSSWAYLGIGKNQEADLFLICPTVDMGEDGRLNMSLSDEETKASFVGALNMERGIYEDAAVMYAPFYRQMTFPVYAERVAEDGEHLEIAYSDVEDAFIYYLENYNNGRPFILAGFSQGAQLALLLLENLFQDSDLQERLVAAYIIGWKVTEEDLWQYPHLKMATGGDDTGVIVSFNTEAPGVDDSIIVPAGTETAAINPLNWKTDSTKADKSMNKGACFTDYSGTVTSEVSNLTGAYIDDERGTLKAVDIVPEDYSSSLFPDGVYHLYDYQFFFRNLQENVSVRTEAWMNQEALNTAV